MCRIVCGCVGIEPNVECPQVCMVCKRCQAYKERAERQENKFPDDFQPDPEANVFHETFH